jgi:hypothetical protein
MQSVQLFFRIGATAGRINEMQPGIYRQIKSSQHIQNAVRINEMQPGIYEAVRIN